MIAMADHKRIGLFVFAAKMILLGLMISWLFAREFFRWALSLDDNRIP